ncbi:ribonuclease H-like domain-containing protein [Tanacetum coccineum]
MITRSQSGIVKPIDQLSLNTFMISHIPKNPSYALKDPNGVMLCTMSIMRCLKMALGYLYQGPQTLSRYKARLVANGSSQQLGVDFDETFSLVVKPATIRTVLSLAVSRKWPIHQLDVKNAFLNGDLSETVYMHQPPGFVDASSAGIVDFGLQLYASATTSLVGYTDADWAGCPSTRRSTSGYCVFLGDNLLSWSTKRQHALSRSSDKAEYHGVANVVVETAWLRNLLRKLHSSLSIVTLVYCDNVSVVYMFDNPVQHQQTKHIEIDIHFIRDMVTVGQVRVLHVPSRYQYANIFTKGLPSALFEEFQSSLSIHPAPALTAWAYLLWSNHILPIFTNQKLLGHIDGTSSSPSATILRSMKNLLLRFLVLPQHIRYGLHLKSLIAMISLNVFIRYVILYVNSTKTFSTTIRATKPAPLFRDVVSQSESHELFRSSLHGTITPSAAFNAQHNITNSQDRGHAFSSRGMSSRGRGCGSNRRPPHYQLCRTNGQYASSCPSIASYTTQASSTDESLARAFHAQCNVTTNSLD